MNDTKFNHIIELENKLGAMVHSLTLKPINRANVTTRIMDIDDLKKAALELETITAQLLEEYGFKRFSEFYDLAWKEYYNNSKFHKTNS